MLCLKMLHNMNRAIAIRVAELKDAPTAEQPNKRATLRCFAELVLNTIAGLLRSRKGILCLLMRKCSIAAASWLPGISMLSWKAYPQT